MPRTAKPAPWKTDTSADAVRFGRRKGSSKGSPASTAQMTGGGAAAAAPQGVPGEADQWGTTFEASYGADRRTEDRPSYLKDRPGGSNSRTQESVWQTSNSELGYDPRKDTGAAGGGGAQPGRHALGVGMKPPPRASPGGGHGGQYRDDDGSMAMEYTSHGPIAEAVKRRSKLADPGGSGEADVGGWAHVPKMRLRGQDPLGGPDRGRAGVEWGTLHNLRQTGQGRVLLQSHACIHSFVRSYVVQSSNHTRHVRSFARCRTREKHA